MARQLDGDLQGRAEAAKKAAEKAWPKDMAHNRAAMLLPQSAQGGSGPGLHSADSGPGGRSGQAPGAGGWTGLASGWNIVPVYSLCRLYKLVGL